jgi:hypothetical protein
MSLASLPLELYHLIMEFLPTKILKRKLYYALILVCPLQNIKSLKNKFDLQLQPFTLDILYNVKCQFDGELYRFNKIVPRGAYGTLLEYLTLIEKCPIKSHEHYTFHKDMIEYITLTKDGRDLMYSNTILMRKLVCMFDDLFCVDTTNNGVIFRKVTNRELLKRGYALNPYVTTTTLNNYHTADILEIYTIDFHIDVYDRMNEYKRIALYGKITTTEYASMRCRFAKNMHVVLF